jgi:acyl-CoA oxidase
MASDVQEPPTTIEAAASPYGELQVDVPALTALLDGE